MYVYILLHIYIQICVCVLCVGMLHMCVHALLRWYVNTFLSLFILLWKCWYTRVHIFIYLCMLIGVICRYDYPYKHLLDHVFMPHGWCGLRPPIKLRQHLAFQGRIAKLWAALWKSLVDENLVLLVSLMWVKYSKAKINHPPVITINRWYKPFPNGWFMTLFYPNYVQS